MLDFKLRHCIGWPNQPEQYRQLQFQKLEQWIRQFPLPTPPDYARLLHQLFQHEFRCASIRHNTWYQFQNHRWQRIEGQENLLTKLVQHLSKLLNKFTASQT